MMPQSDGGSRTGLRQIREELGLTRVVIRQPAQTGHHPYDVLIDDWTLRDQLGRSAHPLPPSRALSG